MAKEKYNLINGLFQPPKESAAEKKASSTTSVTSKKRTFSISNEFWDDFVDLAAAKKMTQAELLNSLIEQVVKENTKEIERYREFFRKK